MNEAILATDRSETWWWLSRIYLERPQAEFLRDLAVVLADSLETIGESLRRPVSATHCCLAEADQAELAQRLAPEYTRLLRGMRAGIDPPPPYESLYRGGELMGAITQSVRRHYLRAGFDAIAPEAGPQDHLGAELRFLSLLCYRETQAWEEKDRATALGLQTEQKAFLDAHLLVWLPDFARQIEEQAREPFYKTATLLTLRFAELVRAELDAALDEGIQVA